MVTASDLAFVNRWQRDFPLAERPFLAVGRQFGIEEESAITIFARLIDEHIVSRIGAIVRPRTVGASTLAAISVPEERLDAVAEIVSEEPHVNHNYEREHALNLWFVVTGPDAGAVAHTLARIERKSGLPVINLPLVKAYHLDLGFPLTGSDENVVRKPASIDYQPDLRDRGLLAAIEDGIPLTARPYREVGNKIGLKEVEVISRLRELIVAGVVTRFGCVVRHRALGYTANAMAVWDVPDDVIDVIATRLVENPKVTLCYRRPRRPPVWPFNLFCMVHAKTREDALGTVADLNAIAEIGLYEQAVLFSTRCFKQRGALFSNAVQERHQ